MTTHTPDKTTTNATKLVARKKPVVGKGANASKGASTPTGKKVAKKRKAAGSSSIDYNNLAPGVRSSMTSS